MIVELFAAHGLQAARGHLGDQRKYVGPSEGGEGRPLGRSEAAFAEAGFRKALGRRNAHGVDDQYGVEIGFVQGVVMDVGGQIAGRCDESALVLEQVSASEIGAVLHVEPAWPVGHVVETGFVDRRPLVDRQAAIADESVLQIIFRGLAGIACRAAAGSSQRGVADKHELGKIGPVQGALG